MNKIIMFFCIMIMVVTLSASENLKMGFIDMAVIQQESNDFKAAGKVFQGEYEMWSSQAEGIYNEIERLQTQYESRRTLMNEAGKKTAEENIEAKITEFQQFRQSIFGENGVAEKRYEELLSPILEKINGIIKRVAIANNYVMIFELAGVVYADENLDLDSIDVTDLILTELNR